MQNVNEVASSKPRTSLDRLRRIGKLEAVSFLLLLGVAMPLKYFAGIPMAVKVAGWLHGVLFISLLWALYRARSEARLPLKLLALVFVAALLPFGPFVIDARLAQFERA